MTLQVIRADFSVCRVADYSSVNLQAAYCFIGKTDEENSLVCQTADVPPATRWNATTAAKAFRIEGTLDFSLIGILAKLSALLAQNGVGVFAISTFNTDYILTKKENFAKALDALREAGYEINE